MDFEKIVLHTLGINENSSQPFPSFTWEKKIVAKCADAQTGYGISLTAEVFEKLYKTVAKNYFKKNDVDIDNVAVQDLFINLYINPAVNSTPGADTNRALVWTNFRGNVEAAYNVKKDPDVIKIITTWCDSKVNLNHYQPLNGVVLSKYKEALKEKDLINRTLIETYSNETIFNTIVKILQYRISNLTKFKQKLVNIVRTPARLPAGEEVMKMLTLPNSYLQGKIKISQNFAAEVDDTRPRDIQVIGLYAKAFFVAEVERLSAPPAPPAPDTPEKAAPGTNWMGFESFNTFFNQNSIIVEQNFDEYTKQYINKYRQEIEQLERMSGELFQNYLLFLRDGTLRYTIKEDNTERTEASKDKYTLSYLQNLRTVESERLINAITNLCEYRPSSVGASTLDTIASIGSNLAAATGAKLYG